MGGRKLTGPTPQQLQMLRNPTHRDMLLLFHCLGISPTGYIVFHFDQLLLLLIKIDFPPFLDQPVLASIPFASLGKFFLLVIYIYLHLQQHNRTTRKWNYAGGEWVVVDLIFSH